MSLITTQKWESRHASQLWIDINEWTEHEKIIVFPAKWIEQWTRWSGFSVSTGKQIEIKETDNHARPGKIVLDEIAIVDSKGNIEIDPEVQLGTNAIPLNYALGKFFHSIYGSMYKNTTLLFPLYFKSPSVLDSSCEEIKSTGVGTETSEKSDNLRYVQDYTGEWHLGRVLSTEKDKFLVQFCDYHPLFRERVTADRVRDYQHRPFRMSSEDLLEEPKSPPESVKIGRYGLINVENICFINAVLQCIFHLSPFKTFLLQTQDRPGLTNHLAKWTSIYWNVPSNSNITSTLKLTEFYDAVRQKDPSFTRMLQHDASEFLQMLLDSLHEENKNADGSSFVYQQCQIPVKFTVKFAQCHHLSERTENTLILQIPLEVPAVPVSSASCPDTKESEEELVTVQVLRGHKFHTVEVWPSETLQQLVEKCHSFFPIPPCYCLIRRLPELQIQDCKTKISDIMADPIPPLLNCVHLHPPSEEKTAIAILQLSIDYFHYQGVIHLHRRRKYTSSELGTLMVSQISICFPNISLPDIDQVYCNGISIWPDPSQVEILSDTSVSNILTVRATLKTGKLMSKTELAIPTIFNFLKPGFHLGRGREHALRSSLTSLPIVPLEHLLQHMFKPESMVFPNQPLCSTCKLKRDAVRTSGIQQTPPLLIFQLMRFVYPTEKIINLVEFKLKDFSVGSDQYQCVGVVNHHGMSTTEGHFSAYVWHKMESKWMHFDDSRVIEMPEESQIITRDAYLLFYERQAPK